MISILTFEVSFSLFFSPKKSNILNKIKIFKVIKLIKKIASQIYERVRSSGFRMPRIFNTWNGKDLQEDGLRCLGLGIKFFKSSFEYVGAKLLFCSVTLETFSLYIYVIKRTIIVSDEQLIVLFRHLY